MALILIFHLFYRDKRIGLLHRVANLKKKFRKITRFIKSVFSSIFKFDIKSITHGYASRKRGCFSSAKDRGKNKEGGRKEEAEKDAAFYFSREPLGESSRVPLAGALACSVQAWTSNTPSSSPWLSRISGSPIILYARNLSIFFARMRAGVTGTDADAWHDRHVVCRFRVQETKRCILRGHSSRTCVKFIHKHGLND